MGHGSKCFGARLVRLWICRMKTYLSHVFVFIVSFGPGGEWGEGEGGINSHVEASI